MLKVLFTGSAPQSARQSAIAAVEGSVVGGFLLDDDGEYFVRIPDTTYTGLQAALERLDSLSQIAGAFPMFIDSRPIINYRKPLDGPGFRQWRLQPNSISDGDLNWQLEAINAPMAWGCSTGDTATTIAVVDAGIARAPTFAANLGRNIRIWSGTPKASPDVGDHGTRVAELIASAGNDGQFDTGVMWRARMDLWDYSRDSVDGTRPGPEGAIEQLEEATHDVVLAGLAGARVINLSAGLNWIRTPSDTNVQDRQVRELAHLLLEQRIKFLDTTTRGPFHPLIVLSAGNGDGTGHSIDAKWGGFPEVHDDFPDQVIVVGASMANGAVAPGLDIGPLVDLYAPGWLVNTYGLDTALFAPTPAVGTSFSAPLVTGTAGLLSGFDPRLSGSADPRITTPLLRSYILAGARTSLAGVKVLDAYGALRVAAQQPGAPLCGNRLWVEGDNVRVQRTPTLTETIAHRASGSAFVSAYHGGKRFDLDYSREFTWASGSWTEAFGYSPAPDAAQGGAFWSYNQADHDDRQFVSGRMARDTGTTGNDTVTVTFTDSLGNAHQFTRLFPVVRPDRVCVATSATFNNAQPPDYIGNFCTNRQRLGAWDDIETIGQNGTDGLFPVLAPQADFILLPLATMHRTVSGVTAISCDRTNYGLGIHDYCGRGAFTDSSIALVIYKIKISDGTWTPIALDPTGSTSRDRGYYEWLEVNESGDQLVIGAGEHVRSGAVDWGIEGGESKTASPLSVVTAMTNG